MPNVQHRRPILCVFYSRLLSVPGRQLYRPNRSLFLRLLHGHISLLYVHTPQPPRRE